MQRESRHLATIAVGGLFLLTGLLLLFSPFLFGWEHEGFREKMGGSFTGAGGILLAFGDPRAAIDGVRKLLPWGKGNSRDSASMSRVDEGGGPG